MFEYLKEYIDKFCREGDVDQAYKMIKQSLEDGHITQDEFDLLNDFIDELEYDLLHSNCCDALIEKGRCFNCKEIIK